MLATKPDTAFADTTGATWGLRATRVVSSPYTGCGVRVAVLDTGIDIRHPDFAGRPVVSRSFVPGASVDDRNGHGTFCAGIVSGPHRPSAGPRYGIAPGAELYIAKVLNDEADGMDPYVIEAIDWAVDHRCAVISLSVGSPAYMGEPYRELYETAAARALAAGSLLVAPAGNASQRPETIEPVEHPANCPSILAVGAIDEHCTVAPFSNGGLSPPGGLDLTAPGVAIYSAASGPALYQIASGTSMAASHVAGIAALFAEANPRARGPALRALLLQASFRLGSVARGVEVRLVRAPQ